MPLDVLDQETVNKLPRLSELDTAYGVQVNAIDVDELFALYERTGFLYPEKAARLMPHLQRVKENWDRMLRAGESLLYVLTAGEMPQGRASLAVWRSTRRGWTYQHLISEGNPYASRAVMLAAEAAMILKGSEESAQNWFRPENRFPARVFGSMAQAIGESLSSVQKHAYLAFPREASLHPDGSVQVVPYEPSRKADLCALAAQTRGHVYVAAEELTGDVPLQSLDVLYRQVGLRRYRHAWLAYREKSKEPVGAVIASRGPLGLNFSFLENRCDLLLSPYLSEAQLERVSTALLAAAIGVYEKFELEHIPLIASERDVAALSKLGGQFVRHYCQCIWLKDGYPRSYRHVDSFYSRILARAGRRELQTLFTLENSQ
jgi:hypothetical protein